MRQSYITINPTDYVIVYNHEIIDFIVTCYDADYTIVSRRYSIDGGAWTTFSDNSIRIYIDTRDYSNGTHTLLVQIKNDAGVEITRIGTFTLNTPAQITSPNINYKTLKSKSGLEIPIGFSGNFTLDKAASKVEIYADQTLLKTYTNLKKGTHNFGEIDFKGLKLNRTYSLYITTYNSHGDSYIAHGEIFHTIAPWLFGNVSLIEEEGDIKKKGINFYTHNRFKFEIQNESTNYALPLKDAEISIDYIPDWEMTNKEILDKNGQEMLIITMEYRGFDTSDMEIPKINITASDIYKRNIISKTYFKKNNFYRIADLSFDNSINDFSPITYYPIRDLIKDNFIANKSFTITHRNMSSHSLDVSYEYSIYYNSKGLSINNYLEDKNSDSNIDTIIKTISNAGIKAILEHIGIPIDNKSLYTDKIYPYRLEIQANDGLQIKGITLFGMKISYDDTPTFSTVNPILRRSTIAYKEDCVTKDMLLETGWGKVSSDWFSSRLMSKGQYVFIRFPKPEYYNNDKLTYYLIKKFSSLKGSGSYPEKPEYTIETEFTPLDFEDYYVCKIYSGNNYRPNICETYEIMVKDTKGNKDTISLDNDKNNYVIWCNTNQPNFEPRPKINTNGNRAIFNFGDLFTKEAFLNLNIGDTNFIIEANNKNKIYSNYQVRKAGMAEKGLWESVMPSVEDSDSPEQLLSLLNENGGIELPPIEDEETSGTVDALPYSEMINYKLVVEISEDSTFNTIVQGSYEGQINQKITNGKVENILLSHYIENEKTKYTENPFTITLETSLEKFYVRYTLEVGYANSIEKDDNGNQQLETVINNPIISYFYGNIPTVAYRHHQIGINYEEPTNDNNAVVVIQRYGDDKKNIVLKLIDDEGKELSNSLIISLSDGSISGATINCGTW